MRYQFTIRKLLIITLLFAPLLAVLGGSRREAMQIKKRSLEMAQQMELMRLQLEAPPNSLGEWEMLTASTVPSRGVHEFDLVYRHTDGQLISARIVAGRRQQIRKSKNFEGWVSRGSRVERFVVAGESEIALRCYDLYAETLDKRSQTMQAFHHDGMWSEHLPSGDRTPTCAVQFRIVPDVKSWGSQVTDLRLLDFANRYLSDLHELLTNPNATATD